jgi:putative transposase
MVYICLIHSNMSTYTQLLYQIVFSTKHRESTLSARGRPALFQYISGILKNKNCHLYRINGVEDHLHIVTHIHPSIAVASLIKDIKIASSVHLKENRIFENFAGWQEGYGAFSYSIREKDRLIEYVKKQEEHHRAKTFRDEFMELLDEHEIEFEEKYLL